VGISLLVTEMYFLLARPVKDDFSRFRGKLMKRGVKVESVVPGEAPQHLEEIGGIVPHSPGLDSPLEDRLQLIGNHLLGRDVEDSTQSPAGGAGAVGAVEGEHTGAQLGDAGAAMRAG